MDPGADVDVVLQSLGKGVGKYHKIQLSILFVFMLENAFHLIAANYVSYRPNYVCDKINQTEFVRQHTEITRNISTFDVKYGKCDIKVDVNATGAEYHYEETCPNGYNYDIPTDRSTVTEWNLVCEGASRSEFAQTLIMMGQAVGAAIFSPLSDKFGRKKTNIIARSLYLIAGVTAMFSPSITVFSIYRLLIGTFQGGSVITGTTLCVELLPIDHRHKGEGFAFLAWTTGIVFTSVIGYICRELPWRYFQMILGLLSWHVIIDWMFFDESLRWLIANGKKEEATKIIKKAAILNNKTYEEVMENIKKKQPLMPVEVDVKPPELNVPNGKIKNEHQELNGCNGKHEHEHKELNGCNGKHEHEHKELNCCNVKYEHEHKEQNGCNGKYEREHKELNGCNGKHKHYFAAEDQNKNKVQNYSAFTILKHKIILRTSIILWFIWITNTLTYYGLMLMTTRLAGDRYLNNILAALAEFPAIILQQIIINRIGRRYVLVMYHSLAGVTLILATVCSIYSKEIAWLVPLSTFFSILGRFAAVGSFSSIFLYTPELYPTNLRNVGLGMSSTVSRVGSMISPFAASLAEHVSWGPALIFVLMNIISVVFLLTLPETMGRELPTTVQEMKSWFKERKGIFDVKWPSTYRNQNTNKSSA